MQHHIFLSYSRRNLKTMQRVRDDLRAAGLSVWTDEGIEPGSISWKEAIEKAIRKTGILVVLLSPSANDSRWVQREIDYAEAQNKPILPILIQGEVRDAIPFALAGSQFVDLRRDYENGFSVMLRRCYRQLPTSHMPTVPARRAASTFMNYKVRKKRKRIQVKQLMAAAITVMVVSIVSMLIIWQKPQTEPDHNLTSNTENNDNSDHNLSLVYTRDTLLVHNISSETLSLENILFELESNSAISFSARNWVNQVLAEGHCVQVWDNQFSYLSRQAAPADICESRVAYRQTRQIFWVSSGDIRFVVKHEGNIIARCQAISPSSLRTFYCPIQL